MHCSLHRRPIRRFAFAMCWSKLGLPGWGYFISKQFFPGRAVSERRPFLLCSPLRSGAEAARRTVRFGTERCSLCEKSGSSSSEACKRTALVQVPAFVMRSHLFCRRCQPLPSSKFERRGPYRFRKIRYRAKGGPATARRCEDLPLRDSKTHHDVGR